MNKILYIRTILDLYLSLPDTPLRTHSGDRRVAEELFRRNVTIERVETAILIAAARRHVRGTTTYPLAPIRSLAYFLPILDEMPDSPLPPGYLNYLRQARPRSTRSNAKSAD